MSNTGKQQTFLKLSGTIKEGNSFTIDHNLPILLNERNQCLGIIFHKIEENKNATLTSWKCDEKKRFLCSLDLFKFTQPTAKARLPCMPPKMRKKRGVHDDIQSDNGKFDL